MSQIELQNLPPNGERCQPMIGVQASRRAKTRLVYAENWAAESTLHGARRIVMDRDAAIVLPPSLVAGLLGMNIKVIPFVDHPWTFAIVCGVLIGAAAIQFWVFRRLNWI